MKNLLYVFLIPLVITACSVSNNMSNSTGIINNMNSAKTMTLNKCTDYSYISSINDKKYGHLFTEYIRLNSSCRWNGLSRGYFEYQFRTDLKLSSFKVIQRKEVNNYEFTKYLINDKYYMNLVYKYGTVDDTFIIDYNGIYTNEFMSRFGIRFTNNDLNKQRFDSNYYESLVNKNFINHYFYKEYLKR